MVGLVGQVFRGMHGRTLNMCGAVLEQILVMCDVRALYFRLLLRVFWLFKTFLGRRKGEDRSP
jgi:hypothetical protein